MSSEVWIFARSFSLKSCPKIVIGFLLDWFAVCPRFIRSLFEKRRLLLVKESGAEYGLL